jgi:hypothetical protein
MTDDSPMKFVDSLGINGQVNKAMLRGDLQNLILSMLSGQKADPWLDIALLLILGESRHSRPSSSGGADRDGAETQDPSHCGPSDIADLNSSDNGQLAAGATLRRVTRMLGARSTCCGDEASGPECRGSGKPGSVRSIARAEELWAWTEPALHHMGIHITNPGLMPTPGLGTPQPPEGPES